MKEPNTTQLLLEWSDVFLRTSMQDFNRFARASGLSMLQLTVMVHLFHRGPQEVTAFAEIMQVSPAGASQMVERLVQEGMVERHSATADRRVREVHLTDAGRKVVKAGIAARRKWLELLLADISVQQRAVVGEALEVLIGQATRLESADPDQEKIAG